jgi:ribosomal protein S18 acetylase RimI-like enzyme
MEMSDWTGTGLIDGVPVCMFGVAPIDMLAGLGQPWLVTTNAVARHERVFLRRCRPVVAAMLDSYPRLTNIVHADNVRAIKWLRWLGFKFKGEAIRVNDVAFRQFRKGAF